jgi:hypothetical protein
MLARLILQHLLAHVIAGAICRMMYESSAPSLKEARVCGGGGDESLVNDESHLRSAVVRVDMWRG